MKFERSYVALKPTCPKCGKDFITMIELNHNIFDSLFSHKTTCTECGEACNFFLKESIHIDIHSDSETTHERVGKIVHDWLDEVSGQNTES